MQAAANLKVCPFCKERIRQEAVKCRYCGEWLEQPRNRPDAPPIASNGTVPSPKSEPPVVDNSNLGSTGEPVGVADREKPPTESLSPSPEFATAAPDTERQEWQVANYWDGYIYAMFCGYVTYSCITHLLGTISRPPAPGDAEAQGRFWGGIVIWSLATAAFSYATYQLVTRRARLRLIYSLVTLHGINVVARGIRPEELLLWLILSGLVISRFRQRQNPASDKQLRKATALETKGRVQEALAIYEQVAQRYPGTSVGRDAQNSIDRLLSRANDGVQSQP